LEADVERRGFASYRFFARRPSRLPALKIVGGRSERWFAVRRAAPRRQKRGQAAGHTLRPVCLYFAFLRGEGTSPIKRRNQRHRLPFESPAHEGSDGSSKCIFDLMQPERPKVDRAMPDFVTGQKFSDSRS
jgi:hypothetical protein